MALVHYGTTTYDDALESWRRALRSLREVDDRGLEIDVFMNIGNLHADRGQFEETDLWHARALELAEKIADPFRVAWISMNLGVAYGRRNDYERARGAYERALRLHRRVGAAVPVVNCLINLGADAGEQGRYEEATRRVEEALQLARRTTYPRGEMYALITLGELRLQTGDLDESEALLASGAAVAEELTDRYAMFAAHCRRTWVAQRADRRAAATHHFDNANALAEELDSPAIRADCLFAAGLHGLATGAAPGALRAFAQAYGAFHAQGRRWWAAVAAAHAALASRHLGRPARGWLESGRAAIDGVDLTDASVPRRLLSSSE